MNSHQNTNWMTKEAGFDFRQWKEIILSSGSIQTVGETQPASNPVDFRTLPPGSKAVGVCSWSHISTSAEVHMWSCTATVISALMAWHVIKHRDNFTF